MIKKYYSEKQIYGATFFGGPIPAGILIYRNLKRIDEDRKASLTLMLTFLFTILLFYALIQIPETIADKILNIVFTSICTIIVYVIYRRFLADEINTKIIEPENKVSNWNVAGITLMGLLINVLIILGIALSEPAFPGEKMTFGELKHEVFFDKEDVSIIDVQTIGQVLTDFEYFNNEFKESVRIENKSGSMQLKIPLQKEFWYEPDILITLNELKNELKLKLNKEIDIVLIHYDLSGESQTTIM